MCLCVYSFVNVTFCPGHLWISVTLQIQLVGNQTSDRLRRFISFRGLTVYTHTTRHCQDNTVIRSVSDWGNQGVAARPRQAEVNYVCTKGHEGSSIDTVLPDGYGSECCWPTHTFTRTHTLSDKAVAVGSHWSHMAQASMHRKSRSLVLPIDYGFNKNKP